MSAMKLCLGLVGLIFTCSCPGSGPQDKPALETSTGDTDTSDTSAESCTSTPWHLDLDEDGFGDPDTDVVWSCDAVEGRIADGADCDDMDASRYPGAPELCMDGHPNDCLDTDGTLALAACPPEGPFPLDGADAKLLGEDTSDRGAAGSYLTGVGDMDGDGHDDLLISIANVCSGALVLGPVSGRFDLAEAQAWFTDYSYLKVRPAGDMDLDGYGDLVAGEPDETHSAWVMDGPFAGEVSVAVFPSVFSDYIGDVAGTWYDVDDNAGSEVVVPGDLNGDGWQDLIVGAPAYTEAVTDSTEGYCPDESVDSAEGYAVGAAYVVYGPVTATGSLSEADGLLIGESTEDSAGYRLAHVGDLDGDGLDDAFVGAGWQCEGGEQAGAAYVVLGPASGVRSLADADMKLIGAPGDGPTMVISGAGDTNGDGYPDLLVGTSHNEAAGSGAGRANLVLGPPGADRSLGGADAHWVGERIASVGISVSSASDMDADGMGDVLIGANNHLYDEEAYPSEDGEGATALTYGPIEGTLQFADLKTVFLGPNIDDKAGTSVASAGDVDADGRADLLIGAPYDDEAGENAGAAYLILGGGAFLNGGYGP